MRGQIWEIARAVSVLLNTLTGGESRETLCGRCYRNRKTSRAAALGVVVLNTLFFWEHNHCRRSNVADELINSRHWTRQEALEYAARTTR